jgi:hypothetical protein
MFTLVFHLPGYKIPDYRIEKRRHRCGQRCEQHRSPKSGHGQGSWRRQHYFRFAPPLIASAAESKDVVGRLDIAIQRVTVGFPKLLDQRFKRCLRCDHGGFLVG